MYLKFTKGLKYSQHIQRKKARKKLCRVMDLLVCGSHFIHTFVIHTLTSFICQLYFNKVGEIKQILKITNVQRLPNLCCINAEYYRCNRRYVITLGPRTVIGLLLSGPRFMSAKDSANTCSSPPGRGLFSVQCTDGAQPFRVTG